MKRIAHTKLIMLLLISLVLPCAVLFAGDHAQAEHASAPPAATASSVEDTPYTGEKIKRTKAQWKRRLTREQYIVTREAGTEQPYTSSLLKTKAKGTYHCASCNLALFSSEHKYDSKTGWPSFFQPLTASHLTEAEDRSSPMEVRTEVLCSRCDAHLGHVFTDGPQPTGLRYCMNGVALKFAPAAGARTTARRTARRR